MPLRCTIAPTCSLAIYSALNPRDNTIALLACARRPFVDCVSFRTLPGLVILYAADFSVTNGNLRFQWAHFRYPCHPHPQACVLEVVLRPRRVLFFSYEVYFMEEAMRSRWYCVLPLHARHRSIVATPCAARRGCLGTCGDEITEEADLSVCRDMELL
jgi:hypothetical protein